MPKQNSKTNPRLVVYVTIPQLKAAREKAAAAGLKNANQWAGTVLRKELATN